MNGKINIFQTFLGRTFWVLPFLLAISQVSAKSPPQPILFKRLARQCAPAIHPETLQALVRVESGFNPYAIGVVSGSLMRQPRNFEEAQAAVKSLRAQGKNFSMGLGQINVKNLKWLKLTDESVFDPCLNLQAAQKVLTQCFDGAFSGSLNQQQQLQKALSCYYSGDYKFGFTRDFPGQPSYVQKVVNAAGKNTENQTVAVPAIDTSAKVAAPKTAAAKKTRRATETDSSEKPQKLSQAWDVFGDF